MSRADDKYIDMEIALTDEWLKQGRLTELTFADAIEYGYKQAKEEMMKDAVEVEVFDDWQYGKDADRIVQPAIKLRCPELKIGQKVKVIIIKK